MLQQWDKQALGRGLWTGKLMSLCDCNGAQGIRNIFLWSAFQIILNSLIYFPTRGGRVAWEPQGSPAGVQSYYILIWSAHTLLLGLELLRLGEEQEEQWADLRQTSGLNWQLNIECFVGLFWFFSPAWIFSGTTAWQQWRVHCSSWGCLLTGPGVNSFPWQGPHPCVRANSAHFALGAHLALRTVQCVS